MSSSSSPPPSDETSSAREKQPGGLFVLFGVEMWERFSYYGMRALLVIFLINTVAGFGYDKVDAYRVYTWYTTAVYITPVIGGWLADRILGTHRALLIGAVVITAGHFSLAVGTEMAFYVGLVLIALGTGFFKSNISTMVGQLYREGDRRRDAGFTIFYMGINLGAFTGQMVCGWFSEDPRFGWHWAFGAAGVGMLAGLIMYLIMRPRHLANIGLRPARRMEKMAEEDDAEPLSQEAWERIAAIALFAIFNLFFWAAFEQAGSTMNVFALERTNRMISDWEIPVAWFQTVNPAVIIIFAPLFARIWMGLANRGKEPSTPLKMALGMILLGLGFVPMVIGAQLSDAGELVSPVWLVLSYTIITWGELCLSPVGLAMVTRLAPPRFASLLMGLWFLSMALANFLAGLIAQVSDRVARGELYDILGGQADFFLLFVITSFVGGALLLGLTPLAKKLMHGRA